MNHDQIDKIFSLQTSYANEIRQTDHKVRIKKIQSIVDWIYNNRDQIQGALEKDLSKNKYFKSIFT